MSARKYKYSDIIFEIKGKIGIIKVFHDIQPGFDSSRSTKLPCLQLNRPKSLNAFGGNLLVNVVTALRELNEHPDTVFTVLTGEGRFFSSGADVMGKVVRLRSIPGDGKLPSWGRVLLGIANRPSPPSPVFS